MKSTDLLQLVDNLQQAGKIHNLQQVCGISGCANEIYFRVFKNTAEKFPLNFTLTQGYTNLLQSKSYTSCNGSYISPHFISACPVYCLPPCPTACPRYCCPVADPVYHPMPSPVPPSYPAYQPMNLPPMSPPAMHPQTDNRHCGCRNDCDEYGTNCKSICSCEEIEIVRKSEIVPPDKAGRKRKRK